MNEPARNVLIRGLDPLIVHQLKFLSEQNNVSMNTLMKSIMMKETKQTLFQPELSQLEIMNESIEKLTAQVQEFTVLVTELIDVYREK